MALTRIASGGLVYYLSPRLAAAAVPHAFSTRIGGVSPEPFASLNLGATITPTLCDDPAHVRENYRRLLSAMGCADRQWVYVHQVHGNAVIDAIANAPFECGQFADAIVSDDPARIISVRTADCVPVLLADFRGKYVSAIHAGWRGVIAGTVLAAIKRMADRFDARPETLLVAVGPCIGRDAFEVGPEVLAEFANAFGNRAPIKSASGGKGHVDLKEAIRLQLLTAGVPAENIDISDHCTVGNADEFFSHRRDAGRTGRMAACISPRSD